MHKNGFKKGFTLIELLVVVAVSSFLIASLAGGIVNLQAIVRLDNAIRDLKISIQTTQNLAFNSFLTYDRNNPRSAAESFFQGGRAENNVSLGWMITFQNKDNNSVLVIRRSVFFKPSTNYDFNKLRDEIEQFRKKLINEMGLQRKFECDSSGNFLVGGSPLSNYVSIGGGIITINCASNSYSGSEYLETVISNINLINLSTNFGPRALPSCWQENGQNSIFFTSGYAKTSLKQDCQLQIQYASRFNQSTRALKVSSKTGEVLLCGSYCTF